MLTHGGKITSSIKFVHLEGMSVHSEALLSCLVTFS